MAVGGLGIGRRGCGPQSGCSTRLSLWDINGRVVGSSRPGIRGVACAGRIITLSGEGSKIKTGHGLTSHIGTSQAIDALTDRIGNCGTRTGTSHRTAALTGITDTARIAQIGTSHGNNGLGDRAVTARNRPPGASHGEVGMGDRTDMARSRPPGTGHGKVGMSDRTGMARKRHPGMGHGEVVLTAKVRNRRAHTSLGPVGLRNVLLGAETSHGIIREAVVMSR